MTTTDRGAIHCRMHRLRVSAIIVLALALAACTSPDQPQTEPASDAAASAAREPGGNGPDAAEQARLRALGYVGWDEASPDELARSGVTIHRRDRAIPGLNLHCSEPGNVLRFTSLDGTEVHTIELDRDPDADRQNYCKVAVPHGTDALVVVLENTKLVSVGLDGVERWAVRRRFHHDVHVTPDGRILAIAAVQATVDAYPAERPITDSLIVTLDGNGQLLSSISVATLVAREPALLARARAHLDDPYPYWKREGQPPASAEETRRRKFRRHDPLHVNTVAMLPFATALPGGGQAPAGSILFCARNLDTIGIIDPKGERILWHWGIGELQWPHHPTLLQNGRILLVDNGVARGQSRLLELDPSDATIAWRYDPGPTFFTRSRGSAQRLARGHTLVTESTRGRVFEIDESGEIVWEFLNPETDAAKKRRATIYRMTRLTPTRIATTRWPEALVPRLTELGLLQKFD